MSNDEKKPMANIPPFGLRMQPDLKARVEESARRNGRSLNAEIVQALEQFFPPEPSIDELLDEIERMTSSVYNKAVPGYRKKLFERLRSVSEMIERGELPESLGLMKVLSPAEVEQQKAIKENVRKMRLERDFRDD
jgi:hypothetical protein